MSIDTPHTQTDVLLIDDSITNLRLLLDMLKQQLYRVSVAFDGEKGFQQAVLLQPRLILLDVKMPGIDGFAVCRRLKATSTTRFIPVIFLTAATDVAERLEGFAAGGVDYISKPFSEAEVLARIGVHLELMPKATQTNNAITRDQPKTNPILSRDDILVAAAQQLLRSQLALTPSLDEVARRVGTNRRRINEAFQACCGLSVFGWLREERLRQAHYLVSHTDTPISMISEHLGYSNPTNFTKAFRERFGCSPRVLRNEMRVAPFDQT